MFISNDCLNWYRALLRQHYRAMHALEKDNYDYVRYGAGGESSFELDWHADYLALLSTHVREFFAAPKAASWLR